MSLAALFLLLTLIRVRGRDVRAARRRRARLLVLVLGASAVIACQGHHAPSRVLLLEPGGISMRGAVSGAPIPVAGAPLRLLPSAR